MTSAFPCGCLYERGIALEDAIGVVISHLNACPNGAGCALRHASVRCLGWATRRRASRRLAIIDLSVGELWRCSVNSTCSTIGLPVIQHSLLDATVGTRSPHTDVVSIPSVVHLV